ncbi:hypothetical protein ABZ622_08615 [Streptomyces sp. NPDC007164]|uniref:hypothetical protein n=1 Tax=Streptomyces sp. NPDC007164 TaxID=3156918 RepID=UPI0034020627
MYAAGLFVIGLGIMLAAPCLTAQIASALPVAVVGTILTAGFTHHLPADLGRHTPLPRTVQEALTLAPADHTAITEAFTHGADTALRAAALIVFLAVAGARRADRTAPR